MPFILVALKKRKFGKLHRNGQLVKFLTEIRNEENMKDIQKFMPLDIQLFAENLEDEGNPNAENKETPATTETKKEERLFTREEVERIKAHEKELILADVKKQQEAQRAEADKLAKMDADQQKDYEIEKANKRAL